MLSDVIEAFHSHQRFLVTTHQNPDGDAVGSLLATAHLLTRYFGKTAVAVLPDPLVERYQFLPGLDLLSELEEAVEHAPFDAVVTCDVSTPGRIGDVESLITPEMTSINIDHHVTNPRSDDVSWVDDSAASTSEMLVDLYRELGLAAPPEVATALYTGVLTDTGQFAYRGTTPRSLRAGALLLEWGADYERVAREVYRKTTEPVLRVLGRVLTRMQLHDNGRIALSWIDPEELGVDHEGFVNHLLDVVGVEVAVLMRPLPDGVWKLSFRSGGSVDVAALAGRFGGGGHTMAAGGSFKGELVAALEQVIRVSKDAIREVQAGNVSRG